MHKLNLDHTHFAGLSEEVLGRGNSFTFKAKGSSMQPFIRHGDQLTVEPVVPSAVEAGDIVFCKLSHNRIIVHRIVGRQKSPDADYLLLRGDGLHQGTQYITNEQVLGRIVQVVREDTIINIDTNTYRLRVFFWVKTYPLSSFFYFLPGRVLRKCAQFLPSLRLR